MSDKKFNKHDALRRKAAQGGRSFGGESYLVLPEGVEQFTPKGETYKLDILPYEVSDAKHPDGVPVGETWYTRPFMVHRDIGVNKNRIVCPRSIGKSCPICEEAERISKDPKGGKDMAKGLWPSNRALYNVALADEDEIVVMVFDYSTFLFGELLEKRVSQELDERGDFFELSGGSTLTAAFEEDKGGGFTSFPCVSIDFKKREEYEEALLDTVVNLDEILVILSYDEIMNKFQGVDSEEATATVAREEESPKRSLRRRAAAVEVEKEAPEGAQDDSGASETAEAEGEYPEGMKVCPACEGTKKTARGNQCFICNGKGHVDAKKFAAEEKAPAAAAEEAPATSRRRRRVPQTE